MKTLEEEKNALIDEKSVLKNEIEKSNITFKLTSGKENIKKLLGFQRKSLSKHGLGYNAFSFTMSTKTIFVK